ncbi:MAG: exo-alpha-sialidase [Planctomycetaceae bacterium]|nr:exo-alpha-sialidase [Planctomycetaceae bacterium]
MIVPASLRCHLALCAVLAGGILEAGEGKMRSLSDLPERHVTIAQTEADYISFPDVCVTPKGRLICVYRVADKHVTTRSRLEVRTSDDRGRTWSEPFVLADRGHCPRLAVIENGEVLLISDGTPLGTSLYRSRDDGTTWSKPTVAALKHGIPDRPLRIGPRSLLTTGHRHVGSAKSPLIQSTFRSCPARPAARRGTARRSRTSLAA